MKLSEPIIKIFNYWNEGKYLKNFNKQNTLQLE